LQGALVNRRWLQMWRAPWPGGNLKSIMHRNHLFALVFALCVAPVAVCAQTPATDSGSGAGVDFTTAQKQTIYQSIAKTQKNNAAPVGFRAAVGAIVPSGVTLTPVPKAVAELIPQTEGFETALVEGEVILVDPQAKKVIAVIAPQSRP